MYVVFDTLSGWAMTDPYGHFKVYSTITAARRRASRENNAVYPTMTRYTVKTVSTLAFGGVK